eukprot:jgi/Mesvir1/17153/Mv07579-RA.1
MTIANISKRSARLWAHLAALWGVSLWAYWLLARHYRAFRADTTRYRAGPRANKPCGGMGVASYSVLARDVPVEELYIDEDEAPPPESADHDERHHATRPAERRSLLARVKGSLAKRRWISGRQYHRGMADGEDPDGILDRYFEKFFPGTVLSSSVALDFSAILPLAARLAEAERRLARAEFQLANGTGPNAKDVGRRPTHRKFLLFGTKVDSISYYSDQVALLKQALEDCVMDGGALHRVVPAGFVGFRSRTVATTAAQCRLPEAQDHWNVEPAPAPADVLWEHLRLPWWHRVTRRLVIRTLLLLLILFYMVPIAFVSGMVSLENLEARASWLSVFTDIPFVRALLQGFLPGLVLKIFLALLPALCLFLAMKEGPPSAATAYTSAFSKLFLFVAANIWFGAAVGSSVLTALDAMITDPDQIHTFLASSIPGSAMVFLNLVLVLTAFLPLQLTNLIYLIKFKLKSRKAQLEEDWRDAWAPPRLEYHAALPNEVMTILFGIIYCTINPLIIPVCILRFCVAYLVWTNQLTRVCVDPFDNAGRIWPKIHHRVLVSLAIWQVVMIGLFALKLKPVVAILAAPTLLTTLSFHLWSRSRYGLKDGVLPLEEAARYDAQGMSLDMEGTPEIVIAGNEAPDGSTAV